MTVWMPVKGRVEASGFLIDHALIGEAEARRRVLSMWQPGSSLLAWDQGRWLLRLAEPMAVRTHTAPGAPLLTRGSQLTGVEGIPVSTADLESVSVLEKGEVITRVLGELEHLDPATWISIDGIVVVQLESASVPPLATSEATPPAPVDLRSKARIRAAPDGADQFVAAARQRARTSQARGRNGTGSAQKHPFDNAMAKLALRTPLASAIGRKHARYLDDLTSAFNRGELDEALRRAIPIGGLGTAGLTLRLPGRRSTLRANPQPHSSSGSVPLGPTVNEHLQSMYRDAARRLEQMGRIDEAVFAHADLLNDPGAAVGVLERAKRWSDAAALAEGRQLDAARVMRLWFRAGERYRGVLAARRAGAFAAAIARMGDDDPELIREIRHDWGASCVASGDPLGAVEAMWPDPTLRPLLGQVIDDAIASGGPTGARLSAYRVSWWPTAEHRAQVLALLDPAGEWTWEDRRLFALELAGIEVADPVVDREMCSAVTRTMVEMPRDVATASDRVMETALRKIRRRGDPVLAADVPSRVVAADPQPKGPVRHRGGAGGDVVVHDAAYLPTGDLLVALGQLGVAVVRPDGRQRLHRDVAAEALVVADHAGRALFLDGQGTMVDVGIFDLASGRVRHWAPLRMRRTVDSFDGALWTVIDERGLCIYDTTADRPVVTWRELEPGWEVLDLQRTPTGIGATIAFPRTQSEVPTGFQRWGWSLPSMRLHTRQACEVHDGYTAVTAAGTLVEMLGDERGVHVKAGTGFVSYPADEQPRLVRCAAFPVVAASPGGSLRLDLWPDLSKPASSLYLYGASTVRVRTQPEAITVIDDIGRVIVLDRSASHLIAEFRVRQPT